MPKGGPERRGQVRSPIQVPISVRPRDGQEEIRVRSADLSEGGLSFSSPRPLREGSTLDVVLPVEDELFTLTGAVARCGERLETGEFSVGLCFIHPSMRFRMKMAEQILRIRELRRALSRERGADVSDDAAAREWVDRYAAEFAEIYS